ncbi:PAS domain S-box-containing protein [Rhizobium aquaticum]|uniref:histidine kinase n=1 Tax=Rhizobium aquaticum TaxID=1549636 RepID=A0ABV2J1U8_9HYPH
MQAVTMPNINLGKLFDEAPTPFVLLDSAFNIVGMNQAYLAATMRERGEIIGRNVFDAFPSEPGSVPEEMLRRSLTTVIQTGEMDHLALIPYPIAGRDGSIEERFWSATHTPIRGEDGALYILQNTMDVTELQRLRHRADGRDIAVEKAIMERAGKVAGQNLLLSKEREYLRTLFSQAPSFMAVLRGPTHIFDLANDAYLEIVGRRDIIGKALEDALPEITGQGFIDILDRVFETGEPFVADGARVLLNRGPGGAGEIRFLNFVYQPIMSNRKVDGIFVQGYDVTEQKQAQARLEDLTSTLEERVEARTQELARVQDMLRQSQKMDAIGNLAGGIAHDFNNLLQVIQGSLQLLGKRLTDEKSLRLLDNAMMATTRGAKLSSQLLAFGRRQPLEPRVINLGRLVRDLDDLLRRSIGEGIEIETIVSGGLWNTLADSTNVETALLNLAINARDAMAGHGKLTIELGNAYLDDEYTRKVFGVKPGQYVMLAVTDTGTGIPPDILEKVFDPFFTTKAEGKGTGLGLSMVYGFVKQSGGHVNIYSEPGKGTTVRIYLPRAKAAEDELPAPSTAIVGGNETILVVEDDEAVRETAAELLRELGYQVLLARDGQSGVAIVESGIRFDLLFTDVVMPGPVKSTALAQIVQKNRPNAAVLFNSGYTENSIVHDGKLDTGVNFLGKPYTREQLARKVRQVLDEKRAIAPPKADPHGKTLLCEDEPLIRVFVSDMLADLGHSVVETGTVAQCMAALTPEISLLICDLHLPDGSGLDLAEQARKQFPDLPIIFATGGNIEAPLPGSAILRKPYDEKDLASAIDQLGRDDRKKPRG